MQCPFINSTARFNNTTRRNFATQLKEQCALTDQNIII
jgi:hypothetical protein